MKQKINYVFYILLILSMMGCSLHKNTVRKSENLPIKSTKKEESSVKINIPKNNSIENPVKIDQEIPPKIKSHYTITNTTLLKNSIKKSKRNKITLTFDNVDLYEVIDSILGQILHINFIIDPGLKRKVSFYIDGEYSNGELLNIFSKALDMINISLIKEKNIIKIVDKRTLSKNLSLTSISDYAIDIVKLNDVNCNDIINNIKPFMTDGGTAIAMVSNNSIIIVDKKENIKLIRNILNVIDNDVFNGVKFVVYKPVYFNLEELYDFATNLMKSQELFAKPGVRRDVFIYPLYSSNSILLISKNKDLMNLLLTWFKELDSPSQANKTEIFVYKVENSEAEDIANILKQIYGASAKKGPKGKVIVSGSSLKDSSLSGELVVIPNKTNNTIIIKATPEDYLKVKKILKQIDTIPREVLINVVIAEISYEKGYEYGIEWYLKNKGIKIDNNKYHGTIRLNDGTTIDENSNLGTSGLLGFSYALYNSTGSLRGLFKAIQDHSKINILSAPSILAIDNKEASIEVGQDVPIITQSVTNTNSEGNITNSIQYRKTGIILKVKPKVNSGGLVRLDIVQEVSEAKSNTISGIDSPIFLKRRAETSLVVKNNQTIIIGGLLENKSDKSQKGVPFLQDIPGLGYLFKGGRNKYSKTELMIAITPRVVRNVEEAKLMSDEFLEKIKEIKQILMKKKKEYQIFKDNK